MKCSILRVFVFTLGAIYLTTESFGQYAPYPTTAPQPQMQYHPASYAPPVQTQFAPSNSYAAPGMQANSYSSQPSYSAPASRYPSSSSQTPPSGLSDPQAYQPQRNQPQYGQNNWSQQQHQTAPQRWNQQQYSQPNWNNQWNNQQSRQGQFGQLTVMPTADGPQLDAPVTPMTPEPIAAPPNSNWNAGCNSCGSDPYGNYSSNYGGDCGTDCYNPCAVRCNPWYARVQSMYMTRDTENAEYFSYFDSNEALQLHDSRELVEWGMGYELLVGHCFCACSVEVSYWGLFPEVAESNLYDPAGGTALNTTLNIHSEVVYNPGGGSVAITTLFDAAERHRLRRSYEMHNVECNFLSGLGSQCGGCPPCGSGGTAQWIGGFRFMRFNDGFDFFSDTINTTFTGDPNEVYYAVKTENNLFGLQVGGRGEYWCGGRIRFTASTKFGAFVNQIDHHSFLGGSAGAATIGGAGPNAGMVWDVNSSTSTVSFLGEFDFGTSYQLTQRWSARCGYRVMAVTGMALSTNQLPRDFRGIQDVAAIDTNGSLIIHGGYLGAEFNF